MKIAIIDDEIASIRILKQRIVNLEIDAQICGTAQNVKSGIELIDQYKPDLVFLDISMPDGEGFDVLRNIRHSELKVVFVTAYNEFAIKAFEFSALHYLLKPISNDALIQVFDRFAAQADQPGLSAHLKVATEHINNKPNKIILPALDGLSIIELDTIMYCESSNNYTTFFLKNNTKIVVSKPINNYEKLLSDLEFVRVHNKFLINLNFVKKYVKGRGGYLLLNNDVSVDVSEGRKKEFLRRLGEFARS